MKEKNVKRNGEEITEVRSDGGKLLFIKTNVGYEMKCARTKKVCLVKYEEMLKDCFKCMEKNASGEDFLSFLKKNKQQI